MTGTHHAGVTDPEDLDPARLMATAAQMAGIDDYDDESFVEPMTKWVTSALAEGNLTPIGRMGMQASVVGLLVNRLRFEEDSRRHPEVFDEHVSDPIVILGLMRTGTSKLQRLMSSDPAVQRLECWRLMNPAPFPATRGGAPDPRIAAAREQIELTAAQCPEFMAGHPMAAEEVDEEGFLMELTFQTFATATRVRCPTYLEWWLAQPRDEPYRYLHRLLQYLQWQDGGRRGQPWVLKSPLHLGNLDLVFATFPRATVVHCHRDPCTAIASSARIAEVFRAMSSDKIDPLEIGEMMLHVWSQEMSRNLAQRERLTEDQVIIDVDFADICEDPIGIIRDVQGSRGGQLSSEAEACMDEWDRHNPAHRYGSFPYRLEDYGLTRSQVDAAFASYVDRFATTGARTP